MDLQRFFQLCNPGATLNVAKQSDKDFYIDFSPVRSGSLIREFIRPITFSEKNPTCQLFTGHIGCGKTTELLRLKADLEAENYHVVYFESSQFLDMGDVDISDILMLIARKICESMKEAGLNVMSGYFKKLFQDINDFLTSDVRLDKMEFTLGLAKITAKSKDSPSIRKKLRDYLEARTDNIIDAINEEVLITVNDQLKTIDKKGLVVIVDNLDRIYNVTKTKYRTQPEYIFIDRGDQLQRLLSHLVYTIPLTLTFSNDAATLNSRFGVKPKTLAMIPIQSRDGEYDKKSITLLKQMILARAFPELPLKERFNQIEQLFENKKLFTRICIASGGHVRNLLGLVYSCLRKDDPPFTTEIYNEVIKEFRDDLVRKVEPHEWEMLRRVQENQSVAGEKDYHTLLRSMFVFEYQDKDGVWYGVNPLLKGAKQLNK